MRRVPAPCWFPTSTKFVTHAATCLAPLSWSRFHPITLKYTTIRTAAAPLTATRCYLNPNNDVHGADILSAPFLSSHLSSSFISPVLSLFDGKHAGTGLETFESASPRSLFDSVKFFTWLNFVCCFVINFRAINSKEYPPPRHF